MPNGPADFLASLGNLLSPAAQVLSRVPALKAKPKAPAPDPVAAMTMPSSAPPAQPLSATVENAPRSFPIQPPISVSLSAGGPGGGDLHGIVAAAAEREGLDPALFRALVRQESAFDPTAVSPAGAQGLTQLMPATAKSLGVTNPFDPEQNANAGARLLKQLLGKYGGNVDLALAAYSAGPGAVDAAGGAIPQFAETQDYVRRVKQYYQSEAAASMPAAQRYVFPLVGYTRETVPVINPFGATQHVLPEYQGRVDPKRGNVGVDLGVPEGTQIVSPTDGVVLEARKLDPNFDPGWGNSVLVEDKYGVRHRLSHMRDVPLVKMGDSVQAGQPLGFVGQTGNATGPHLDYEFYQNGQWRNALDANFVPLDQYAPAAMDQPAGDAGQPTDQGTDQGPITTEPTDTGEQPTRESGSTPTDQGTVDQARALREALGVPTDQGTADQGPKTPEANVTLDTEGTRALLRSAGMDDAAIDQMLFRGAYANARSRSVSEIFQPGPTQLDAERLAEVVNTISGDAKIKPEDLAALIDPNKAAQSDDPGKVLFDALWPKIADEYGLPGSKAPDRVRKLLAGLATPRITQQPNEELLYHGTGTTFGTHDPVQFAEDSLYGPGLYLTSDPRVAGSGDPANQGYAEKRGIAGRYDLLPWDAAESRVDQALGNYGLSLNSLPDNDATRVLRRSLSYRERVPGAFEQEVFDIAAQTRDAVMSAKGIGGLPPGNPRRIFDDIRATLSPRSSQVRATRLPPGLDILDAEKPVFKDTLNRIRDTLDDHEMFDIYLNAEMAAEQRSVPSGQIVYKALEGYFNGGSPGTHYTAEDTRGRVNSLLAEAGFDGIRYQGGQITPMFDPQTGKPIEHRAYVIFRDSLDKARNALSGLPESATTSDRSTFAAFMEMHPDLAESLHALLSLKWSNPDGPPRSEPFQVWSVGDVHERQLGPLVATEFVSYIGGVDGEAEWNTILRRFGRLGLAPIDPSFDRGSHAGSVILRGVDPEHVQRIHDQLAARRPIPGGPPADLGAVRQLTPYELWPHLYTGQQEAPNGEGTATVTA